MRNTVLIPTYRRPQDLTRCLKALQQQTKPVNQVIVVIRDTDTATWELLDHLHHNLPLETVTVSVPGVVAALNAGLVKVNGDILSITDDDAAPHPDWLAKINTYFQTDPQIGGVGGRDWVYQGGKLENDSRPIVGKLQWFGRVIGNHHLGIGAPREVDFLKGVNMSFRTAAMNKLRFDDRMRGTGAQVHFEMSLTLTLKRAGWKMIYDPSIAVDHYPAQRFDEDQRQKFNDLALINLVHNETLVLLEHLSSFRRLIFLFWSIFIGTRESFGILQCFRLLPEQGIIVIKKLQASLYGRWLGWQTWQKITINKSQNKPQYYVS